MQDEIDQAIKLALNWPMGPLTLIDYVGADTVLSICRVMQNEFGSKYAPNALLLKLVKEGSQVVKLAKVYLKKILKEVI